VDRDALLERLRGIEWDDFEVKSAARGIPDDAYATVSAFANTAGGWLVFGVAERGGQFDIIGVADPEKVQGDFLAACRSQKLSRAVEVQAKRYEIDGKAVIAFHVAEASRFAKPVRVRRDQQWHAYIRLGSGDHRCSAEEEARFLRDASRETFDATIVAEATVDDLDLEAVRWLRGVISQRDPQRAYPELDASGYLAETGLLRGDREVTHAAAILFGRDRVIARLKPAGIVDFRLVHALWTDDVPEQRWDDRELCEGNLVKTVRALLERFVRLCEQPFALEEGTGQRRAQSPDYRALREALVNLLIHQDYSDLHRTARILWFSDRTIFENPGDSFVSVPDMIEGGASDLRNPLLTRVMRQAGYAEQAGTGIPTIVRTWRAAGRVPPGITNDRGRKAYRLDLIWRSLQTPRDEEWFRRLGLTVSADGGRVLTYVREHGTISRSTARLVTGLGGREVEALLRDLATNRLLVAAEGETAGVFRLAPHLRDLWLRTEPVPIEGEPVSEPVNEPVTGVREPEARAAAVLGLIRRQPGIRVPAIVRALHLSPASVKRALKTLREAGRVAYRGAPKTGGYYPSDG
jgi:ATP-dependent DNA helicase RecG